MADEKKFSKAKWFAAAAAQKERGTLTQREIEDAEKIWVNKIDGKTKAEIAAESGGECHLNDDWFE